VESAMDGQGWILIASIVVCGALVALLWRPVQASWRRARFSEARRDFHRQRERLEAKFVQLGSAAHQPSAPRWIDCEFDDDVAYPRSRTTGALSPFVGVTIAISNPEDDLDPDTIASYRSATAVFRFDRTHWVTDGRAIFNLSPAEAIHFYHRELEMVGQEVAERS
jgi:hypothetical protein